MSFFNELKRRNVIRVGVAYLVTSWLLIQVAETVLPLFGFDDTPARLVVIVLAIGLIPALILAWVFELTPDGIKQEKDIDRSQSVTSDSGQKSNRAIIGVLVVALTYFAVDEFVLDSRREAAMQQKMAATLAAASDGLDRPSDAKSIAILPFVNMSGDAANEPFTLGIHDDLLTHLSRIKSLRTISRTSVLQYRDTIKSIPEIAAELGASNILEGSIQRSGDRIRINLQLIDANTDEHIWAEVYDRDLTAENLFEVQGEITTQVVKSLRATLQPEEQSALNAKPTHSMEAYDLYLLGRHHWNQRTGDSIEKARNFFNQAINVDPDYVLAYSGLADSYSLLVNYGNMTGDVALPLAKSVIDKAMSLDSALSEVWASQGLLLLIQGKNPEAAKALVRAIELDQQNFSAWLWYANSLLDMRRFDEHIVALETAFSLEPMSRPLNINLANAYQNRGDFERSQQHFDRLLDLKNQDTENYRLEKVDSYFWSGQLAKAIEEARKVLSVNPENIQAMTWLIDTYLAFEETEVADVWVERATELDPLAPWGKEVFEARMDFDGGIAYMEDIRQLPGFTDFAGHWYSVFRFAYLGGQLEAAISYFNEYTSIAKGFAEIHPAAIRQRDELRIAEFLLNSNDRQSRLGKKMLNEALSTLQKLNSLGHNHPGTYYGLAMAWTLKGSHDRALEALDKAVNNGFSDRLNLRTEPALRPLREEPRFIEIVDRMNQQIKAQKQLLGSIKMAPYQPVSRREPVEVSRDLLDKYAGHYSDGVGMLSFYLDETGRFMARSGQQPEIHALASAEDQFFAKNAPGYSAQFFMDENNEVTHIMARGGRGLQRFKRVDPPPDPIKLEKDILQRFEGEYSARVIRDAGDGEADTDISSVIIRTDDDNRVWIEYENQPPTEIVPYTETDFFRPGFIHRYHFENNPITAAVERMIQNRDGHELEFKPQ